MLRRQKHVLSQSTNPFACTLSVCYSKSLRKESGLTRLGGFSGIFCLWFGLRGWTMECDSTFWGGVRHIGWRERSFNELAGNNSQYLKVLTRAMQQLALCTNLRNPRYPSSVRVLIGRDFAGLGVRSWSPFVKRNLANLANVWV